jgi:hypothetical protein
VTHELRAMCSLKPYTCSRSPELAAHSQQHYGNTSTGRARGALGQCQRRERAHRRVGRALVVLAVRRRDVAHVEQAHKVPDGVEPQVAVAARDAEVEPSVDLAPPPARLARRACAQFSLVSSAFDLVCRVCRAKHAVRNERGEN